MSKKTSEPITVAEAKAAEYAAEHLTPLPEHPSFQIKDMKDGRSRLRVQFDITYKGTAGKTPQGESMTEPDLTIKLGQLLENHSRGKAIPMREPLYFDTEIPTISDLTDVDRYREQLERRLSETKKFIQQEQDEIAAAKAEKQEKSAAKKARERSDGQLELQDDPTYKPRAKAATT